MPRFVIPPGQERLVTRMLALSPPVADEWSPGRQRIAHTRVRASFHHRRGSEVAIVLAHPASGATGRRTARFSLYVDASTLNGVDPTPLLEAVEQSVRRCESAWVWKEVSDPPAGAGERDPIQDVELQAVMAGAKPALRVAVVPDAVDAARARYDAAGLASGVASFHLTWEGVEHAIVYAAKTRADVEALARVEEGVTRDLGAGPWNDMTRETGARLGYPTCCVEAFVTRQRARPRELDPCWAAAREAWVSRPHSRLNDLLHDERARLISFEPCAYDCAAAIAVAEGTARALAAVDRGSLDKLEQTLRQDVAIHPTGRRFVVSLTVGEQPTIVAARPVGVASEGDASLAADLVGTAVDRRGRAGEAPSTIVVLFAHPGLVDDVEGSPAG